MPAVLGNFVLEFVPDRVFVFFKDLGMFGLGQPVVLAVHAQAAGIALVVGLGSGNGIDWVLDQKEKSNKNEITAPRIEAYTWFGSSLTGERTRDDITTPEAARE